MNPNPPPPAELFDAIGDDQRAITQQSLEINHGTLARVLFHWQPQPLAQPVVDPALPDLPAVHRCAEVIRYSVLRAEYWLSPKGTLREWLRLNLWLATALFVPALLLVPVVTYLLTGVATWTGLLAQTVSNLAWIPAGLLGCVLSLSLLLLLARSLLGRR